MTAAAPPGSSDPHGESAESEPARASALTRVLRSSAFRFVVVGGFSWLVDLALLLVLVRLGVEVWLAAAIAWSTGFVTNYLLNRIWSFNAAATWGSSAWKYVLLAAANAVVTSVVMEIAARAGMDLAIAKTALAGALAVANYFAYRFWVFSGSPER